MKFNKENWLMGLQLFAEGEGAGGGDDGNGSGTGSTAEGSGDLVSFDDFLKADENQAEFDRRVQKAIDTSLANAQKKWKMLTDDKLTEAEKLAKMTKEEKAEYRTKQLERELAELKHKNVLENMAKTARKMLSDEAVHIPDELLVHLVSDDAENTKASVAAFTKLHKEAVQAAVKDALKGNPPKVGTGGRSTITRDQIEKIKDPLERQRLISENLALYQ